MPGEIAVVCSRADPASLNIYERLLELLSWQCHEGYSSYGRWRLIIHDEKQSRLSGLDDRLAGLGLQPEMVVFASRHEAKAGLPWLGGHFTGILEDGQSKLSAAAPCGLSHFCITLHSSRLRGICRGHSSRAGGLEDALLFCRDRKHSERMAG